jgi:hypothetical protein
MTDQIRIAHAAGIRKDRLSSRGQRRRHAWSEAKGATGRPPPFLPSNHRCPDSELRIIMHPPVCELRHQDTGISLSLYSPFDHPLDNADFCRLRRIAEQTAGRPCRWKCLTVLRAVQLISVF